jgi:hypothetical protein
MKLSILIASYNRSSSLLSSLRELTRQAVPEGIDLEVVIVDNNSTDETKNVVALFVGKNPCRFRYFLETSQGKSAALNKGILEAKGEILAFTDDDCLPNPDWVATIVSEFAADPSLGAIGGRVELYDKQDKPVSIRTCTQRTQISTPSQLFSLLIGCNMAVRRGVCEKVKKFDTSLGPGKRARALEDMDFLYRIYKQGFRMLYSPAVLVFHNHGRKSDADVQSLTRNYLIGRGAFFCKHILKFDREILQIAYWEVSGLMKGIFRGLFSGRRLGQEKKLLGALLMGACYRLVWNLKVQKT